MPEAQAPGKAAAFKWFASAWRILNSTRVGGRTWANSAISVITCRAKTDSQHSMRRLWIGLGSLAGFGAVAMAAYAAHGIGDPTAARIVSSGVQMQGWHALALIGAGLWAPRGGWLADAAGLAFTTGLLLFCGAVYAVGLAGLSLGIVAPIGGTLLMFGWLLLGASTLRGR